jgi:hypothetical protein
MQAAPYYIYSLPAKAQHGPIPSLLFETRIGHFGKTLRSPTHPAVCASGNDPKPLLQFRKASVEHKTHFDSVPTPFSKKPAAHWKPPAFLQPNFKLAGS